MGYPDCKFLEPRLRTRCFGFAGILRWSACPSRCPAGGVAAERVTGHTVLSDEVMVSLKRWAQNGNINRTPELPRRLNRYTHPRNQIHLHWYGHPVLPSNGRSGSGFVLGLVSHFYDCRVSAATSAPFLTSLGPGGVRFRHCGVSDAACVEPGIPANRPAGNECFGGVEPLKNHNSLCWGCWH